MYPFKLEAMVNQIKYGAIKSVVHFNVSIYLKVKYPTNNHRLKITIKPKTVKC